MYSEETKYKIFKIFYYNSTDEETLAELEQSIRHSKFINRDAYNIMEDAKIANSVHFKIKENRDNYSDVMYNYNIILQSMSYLAKELNLENSLELSILFSYLLWYGYLSKKQEYKFDSNNKKIIPGLFFTNIMDGRGVCLNNSEMLKDFLNLNEYNSVILENHYDLFTKINYEIDIVRKAEEKKQKMIKKLCEKVCELRKPNHAFNLIEDNEQLYIYDSTNLLLQSIVNQYSSKLINGNGKYKIYPYKSYMLCGSPVEIELLDKFIIGANYTSPYQKSDLMVISEVVIELLRCNKDLLDDFYIEVKPNIIEISEEVSKIKKLTK